MLVLVLRTLMIYLLIVAAMRLMGKRQLGELQPSELVSTILISNLASISIESPEVPLAASLAPVCLIVVLELFSSALCYMSPTAAKLLSGTPVAVIRGGKIDQKTLRELRFSAKQAAGTGLGMSITKNLVSQMDGEIQVESHPGTGSTFTVILPLTAAESPQTPPLPSELCQLQDPVL